MTPALLDVDCPWCGAGPLEPCAAGPGRCMEFSVHGARRIRAGVEFDAEPEPKRNVGGRPKGSVAVRPDPTKCAKRKHEWVEENIYTSPDGYTRCRSCRNDRRAPATKRPRPNVQHRNNGTHCRNGHEYTDANTYHNVNGRNCRQCKRDRDNRLNAKKRANT